MWRVASQSQAGGRNTAARVPGSTSLVFFVLGLFPFICKASVNTTSHLSSPHSLPRICTTTWVVFLPAASAYHTPGPPAHLPPQMSNSLPPHVMTTLTLQISLTHSTQRYIDNFFLPCLSVQTNLSHHHPHLSPLAQVSCHPSQSRQHSLRWQAWTCKDVT